VSAEATTLVILDSGDNVINPIALGCLGGSAVTILSFTQSHSALAEVVAALSPSGKITIESGAPFLDEVAPEITNRFLDLLSRVPRDFKIHGKPLIQAWASSEGASMWWLHELSGRRSDIYPLFTRLCQLEVVRRALHRTGATRVALVSHDDAFSQVMASLCATEGIVYQAPATTKVNNGLSKVGIAARLALWSVRTIVQTGMAKLLTRNTKPVRVSGTPLCCFHSIYPSFFISTRGKGVMDQKLLRVPNLVTAHGVTPFIAVTFAADDGHQHMTMGDYLKACLMLRRRPGFNDIPARLIDRDISWLRMLGGFLNGLSAAFKQIALENNSAFRDQWRLGDVDIFPLIRPELRMATYRTPRYLMHVRRTQASIDAIAPDTVISPLFEFPYGRSISIAIAASRTKPLNIGVQHGPTGRKLMYRYAPGELAPLGESRGPHYLPMPDHLILESEEALSVLSRSGYPLDRIHVLGAPRLDALADAPRWGGPNARTDRPLTVLVIFGGTDGGQIMGAVRPVLNGVSNYHFIFKPHPRSSVQVDQIERFLSVGSTESRDSTYETASGNIYHLLTRADAVITTYSSAGMEAAALGYPTVVLNLPDFASPSGLMDITGNVRFAASPQALADALIAVQSRASADSGNQIGPTRVLERNFFFRLDGKSQERWAEAIADLARQHTAS
jgi:hypothetical protein